MSPRETCFTSSLHFTISQLMMVVFFEILFQTIHFASILWLGVLFVNCSNKAKGKSLGKTSSKQKVDKCKSPKSPGTNTNSGKGNDEDDDVKFNVNVKPKEVKKDEFDDNEENPLAKIPTKPRLPKPKDRKVDCIEAESPFLAPNEKAKNTSFYAKPAA